LLSRILMTTFRTIHFIILPITRYKISYHEIQWLFSKTFRVL